MHAFKAKGSDPLELVLEAVRNHLIGMLEMNYSHVQDHLLTMSHIYSPLPLRGDYIDYSEGYMCK